MKETNEEIKIPYLIPEYWAAKKTKELQEEMDYYANNRNTSRI